MWLDLSALLVNEEGAEIDQDEAFAMIKDELFKLQMEDNQGRTWTFQMINQKEA